MVTMVSEEKARARKIALPGRAGVSEGQAVIDLVLLLHCLEGFCD